MHALCEQCGLSPHMARILLDEHPPAGRRKKEAGGGGPLLLIRAPNKQRLRCMGAEAVARARQEMQQQQKPSKRKKKPVAEVVCSDEQVRKYLLEQYEAELKRSVTPKVASVEKEKLSAIRRDFEMIDSFVGHARISNYFIFVYYVGPETRDEADLARVESWQPVPRSHLAYFHRNLEKRYATYLKHTADDQRELSDSSSQPAYDPRFIIKQWMKTEAGRAAKEKLMAQRDLFVQPQQDYVTKEEAPSDFPFYCRDPSIEQESPPSQKRTRQQLNVDDERKRQSLLGFEVEDDRYREIGHREYAQMATSPLPEDCRLSMQEMIDLSKRTHHSGDRPDQYYELEPAVLCKAASIAFNPDAFAKSTVSRLHQQHLKTVDRDQVEPLLQFLLDSEVGRAAIKEATLEYVWSLLLLDQMAASPPERLEKLMQEREPIVLLDS